MGVLITACGRVTVTAQPDRARLLAGLMSEHLLDAVVRFVLDGGRGSVVLQVKDGRILGGRIDAVIE